MQYDIKIFINKKEISINSPTYFIADIASNHDGSLNRAKELIYLAKEARVDCVKFQHFKASELVSNLGFKKLKFKLSHQSNWKKSTFEVYKQYELLRKWTQELYETAIKADIDFMTTPYDYDAVKSTDVFLSAYKIGSGDITWIEFIEEIAKKNKPIFLSSGASEINDILRAVKTISIFNRKIILLQCNTNYTASYNNFKYINLNVLKMYQKVFPGMIVGLSDHTKTCTTVLGAIALGARVIEKHFTDDTQRKGPDHYFSITPKKWKDMVEMSRELELSLGDGVKRVEKNEEKTVTIQRRCIRLTKNMKKGSKITKKSLIYLRPAPLDSIEPFRVNEILGMTLRVNKIAGDALYLKDFD